MILKNIYGAGKLHGDFPPVLISKGSGLKVNPYYDGITVTELLTPSASFLPQGRGDTLVFAVRVDPRGLYGLLRNQTIGNAYYYNGRLVSDTSNNGFKWDPDLDGNPANNSLVTYINLEPIDLFYSRRFSPTEMASMITLLYQVSTADRLSLPFLTAGE